MKVLYHHKHITDVTDICCELMSELLFDSGYLCFFQLSDIQVPKLVPKGDITFHLNYCPFCGASVEYRGK